MLGQKPGGGKESLGAGVTNICMRPSELTPGGVDPGILRVALSESNLSSPQEKPC